VVEAVYGFPESEHAALRLAESLGSPYRSVSVRRFPDGESLVRVDPPAVEAVLYRSLDRPNDKLVEILLAAAALRDQGCRRLVLVAPYMAYMRQDKAFRSGEAVSQRVVGGWLAAAFDAIVTVNPHLHRTPSIAQVFPGAAALALEAMPLFADLLRNDRAFADAVVVGPDTESETIVRRLAEPLGLEWLVARKERAGDREVRMTTDGSERLAGRTVLLTDDVVSTGTTLAEAAALARNAGAARVEALVVHALLAQAGEHDLQAAGIARLRSSDSIPHPSNAVGLAPLLAPALRDLWGRS
jgi:ribose-phosphate pyrophosphokinase